MENVSPERCITSDTPLHYTLHYTLHYITPDEALVETRRKLVIKRKIVVLFRENEDLWSI